jgi:hypothetical protein
MGSYDYFTAPGRSPEIDCPPGVILPCEAMNRWTRKAEREHEEERERVGLLEVGTRIQFQRPNEKARSGRIVEVPNTFAYRVEVDDGRGDHHRSRGIVSVLWASHVVCILDAFGKVVSKPPRRNRQREGQPVGVPAKMERRLAWMRVVKARREHGETLTKAADAANAQLHLTYHYTNYPRWTRLHPELMRDWSRHEHEWDNLRRWRPCADREAWQTPGLARDDSADRAGSSAGWVRGSALCQDLLPHAAGVRQ